MGYCTVPDVNDDAQDCDDEHECAIHIEDASNDAHDGHEDKY